jgi:hypothetical protein
MLVASSYDEREYGHAGNSFNRFWGIMGASTGGPKAVSAFTKEMHWYNALSRGWDGRMLNQQLGGYYGGITLNLEAAQVLANALPLRKLIITGKSPNKALWLSDEQLDAAISAGRWHWADYAKISTSDLLAALDCWSPGAREWMAVDLAKREGDLVTPLLAALESDSADMRAGAGAALGYQGERAAAAVPALIKALQDPASPVRVAAAYGIMRTGKPGRAAVPKMLKAIVNLPPEGPLKPTLQALAFSLGAEPVNTAPLYFVGILPQYPDDVNPLDGIDRDILYAAFRRMATDRSGRIRDCGSYMLRWFNREDLKANAWEIYNLVHERAPDFGMFSGRARGHGIDILARFKISEGPALTTYSIDTQGWGWFMISPHHFEALQEYGSLAQGVLPWLRAGRTRWSTGDNRAVIEATIAAIEADKEAREGLSLVDLVGERIPANATASDLRRLITETPQDILLHAAALRRLVAILGMAAKPDLLRAFAHENTFLQQEAIALARPLKTDWPILPLTQDKALVRAEFANGSPAAIAALARLGNETDLPLLIAHIQDNGAPALSAALAALAPSYQPLLDALPNASPTAQATLIAALGQMGDIETMLTTLGDRNGHIRSVASNALGAAPGTALTERLLGIAELSSDRRQRSEIANILHKRLILGYVRKGAETALARSIIRLGNSPTTTTRALQQLAWAPSKDALNLALEYLDENATDRSAKALSQAAARAIVDLATDLKPNAEVRAAVQRAEALLAP